MSSRASPLAGPWATRLLARPERGRVIAVFGTVFYVEFPSGLLCVTHAGVAPGPLSLVTRASAATDWPAQGLRVGTSVAVRAEALLAGPVTCALGGLSTWEPEPWAPFSQGKLARSIATLAEASQGLGHEGLGEYLRQDIPPSGAVAGAASHAISDARSWLGGAPDTRFVRGLIGLGPGLTPSGDDFLGGMLLALHATGQEPRAALLAEALLPELAKGTNPISAALLEAAAEGYGAAPMHRAINHLLAGDAPALALDAVASIGHTSGMDALAGAVAVLDALAQPARAAA